ncbi:MAG TPA: hypothetical protein PKD10_14655 [Paracoccaceae bacterium]|nr:hypothetical protein [Paracoccaceae bacterium]HMO70692.1 hypothetical protein [Paracoccaceae bacterium]
MLRDLILRLMPARWGAEAEASSRGWGMTCPSCHRRTSIWDLGGLRWKAAGRPLRAFRCPHCGTVTAAPVLRQSQNSPPDA